MRDASKTYLVEYRAGRGRGFPTRRLSLGRHGNLTVDEARQLAKAILARVASGEDPAIRRSACKNELRVKDILITAIEQHWKPKRKASTAKSFEEMIYRSLIPEFGSLRISELTRTHIRSWHARQTHRRRQANLDLAILRKAISLAVADDLIKDNPAKGISPHPERVRDRMLSEVELRAVWRAIEETSIRSSARVLFKLLCLTGCRKGEWQSAFWTDIDFSGAVLRLRDAKAGARTVPLSGPVMALLRSTERISNWVISNDAGNGPLTNSNIRDAWAMVLSAAGVSDLRIHDMRHAFATRGASLGANALVLRDALGHKTLAMTSRYVSRQEDPVRELAERIGQGIIAATSSEGQYDDSRSGPELSPLRQRGSR